MVLVSKLRGSAPAQQQGATNSFFNKIRSSLSRSSSNTSLVQVASAPVATSRHLQFVVKGAGSESLVEKFDDSTSCDSSAGKRSESPDPCVWRDENTVSLADLEPERTMPESKINVAHGCRQLVAPLSICGSNNGANAPAACHEFESEAEPISPGPIIQKKSDVEALPGGIGGDEPKPSPAVEARPQAATQGEVPRRLWEPSDPPAPQAHPAWQLKRDKEALGPTGNRSRFPARLPPLSGLSRKSLRLLSGSTPVLEVSNLPEPVSSP